MPRSPYLRLCSVLAGSGQADLRRQIQFLKAENEVLRARIEGPVRVTARERYRLVRLARPLGAAIRDLVTIVKPDTLTEWIKASVKKPAPKPSTRRLGRLCTSPFETLSAEPVNPAATQYIWINLAHPSLTYRAINGPVEHLKSNLTWSH